MVNYGAILLKKREGRLYSVNYEAILLEREKGGARKLEIEKSENEG